MSKYSVYHRLEFIFNSMNMNLNNLVIYNRNRNYYISCDLPALRVSIMIPPCDLKVPHGIVLNVIYYVKI